MHEFIQNLLEKLTDPIWWFTAFFVAVVASICAGFLKDAIGNIIASQSTRFRCYRRRRRRDLVETIRNIERDDAYMVFFFVRLSMMMLMFMLMAIYHFGILDASKMSPAVRVFNLIFMTGFQFWFFLFVINRSGVAWRRGLNRYKQRKGLYLHERKKT